MLNKINLTYIVRDQMRTFRDNSTGLTSPGDITLFFGLPVLAGCLFFLFNISSAAGNIITILSIFTGLLLNLLVITFDLLGKYQDKEAVSSKDRTRSKLIEEIYTNIAYSVLVSVIIIILVAPFSVDFNSWARSLPIFGTLRVAAGFLACYLIAHFALIVLMILKRIHALLGTEVKKK